MPGRRKEQKYKRQSTNYWRKEDMDRATMKVVFEEIETHKLAAGQLDAWDILDSLKIRLEELEDQANERMAGDMTRDEAEEEKYWEDKLSGMKEGD